MLQQSGIDASYTELLLSARRFARFRPKLISRRDSAEYLLPCGTRYDTGQRYGNAVREGAESRISRGWAPPPPPGPRRWPGTPEDGREVSTTLAIEREHVDRRNLGIRASNGDRSSITSRTPSRPSAPLLGAMQILFFYSPPTPRHLLFPGAANAEYFYDSERFTAREWLSGIDVSREYSRLGYFRRFCAR